MVRKNEKFGGVQIEDTPSRKRNAREEVPLKLYGDTKRDVSNRGQSARFLKTFGTDVGPTLAKNHKGGEKKQGQSMVTCHC